MTGRLRVKAEANNNRTDLHSLISANVDCCIRPNKELSVFRIMGLKILGRVGTHIFLNYLFFVKIYMILCILNAFCLSKCIKLYFS